MTKIRSDTGKTDTQLNNKINNIDERIKKIQREITWEEKNKNKNYQIKIKQKKNKIEKLLIEKKYFEKDLNNLNIKKRNNTLIQVFFISIILIIILIIFLTLIK